MKKRRLKLTIEFDGTDFFGWQVQSKTGERTVQQVIQAAIAKLPGSHTGVKAAGRTDAGVHALAMAAHFDTDSQIPNTKLLRAINSFLPKDVRIIGLELVANEFEAQYDCLYRQYVYKMRVYRHNLAGFSLDRNRVLPILQDLDINAMQEAASLFEGKHDFTALATQETRSTQREVYLCKLESLGRDLELHIAANGFLRNMVRAVVGTLIYVGEGKLAVDDIPKIIASKDRNRAGRNVAPQGLYFAKAGYEAWHKAEAKNLHS